MKGPVWIALAAAATLACGAIWFMWAVAGRAVALPYEDASAVSEGERLYKAHCADCHGADLEGEPNWRRPGADGYMPAPPHDETGHTWHHPDELLFAITKYGSEAVVANGYRSRMIGFGDVLSDDEILATLAYIKSTWPARVIETHNEINAAAP
jgi:mono/diheme cytochrome c family protein